MMTDPIADMLTRIRNAYAVRKDTVMIPYSRVKESIARVMKEEAFIASYAPDEDGGCKMLSVTLRYTERKMPAIRSIKRVSKPGCRTYVGKEDLPVVLNHLGIAILSTSQGVMTNKQAHKMQIGGEVMCEIS